MTHDEMIAVIQAHKDGREIEKYSEEFNEWTDFHYSYFNFEDFQYRIKPPQIEAWGVVEETQEGNELVAVLRTRDEAIDYRGGSGATIIRLIPDPNYTQSPVSDNQ